MFVFGENLNVLFVKVFAETFFNETDWPFAGNEQRVVEVWENCFDMMCWNRWLLDCLVAVQLTGHLKEIKTNGNGRKLIYQSIFKLNFIIKLISPSFISLSLFSKQLIKQIFHYKGFKIIIDSIRRVIKLREWRQSVINTSAPRRQLLHFLPTGLLIHSSEVQCTSQSLYCDQLSIKFPTCSQLCTKDSCKFFSFLSCLRMVTSA